MAIFVMFSFKMAKVAALIFNREKNDNLFPRLVLNMAKSGNPVRRQANKKQKKLHATNKTTFIFSPQTGTDGSRGWLGLEGERGTTNKLENYYGKV